MLASLLLSCVTLLLVARDSAGGEATATLGVSLIISAGCTVSSTQAGAPATSNTGGSIEQKVTVSVTCTNDVPYQLGINNGAGAAATEVDREPHITLAPGASPASVTVIVTY